jgi:uncharacterized protein YndB with AHSA1/START domain
MWTTSRRIDAPVETVWRILTDLRDWPVWGPTVAGAELDGEGPLERGAQGRVWTPVGVPLPFEIHLFEPGRCWGWKVAGVPATHHGVEPSATGCRAWMSAPVWAPAYLPVLAIALRRIEGMALSRT